MTVDNYSAPIIDKAIKEETKKMFYLFVYKKDTCINCRHDSNLKTIKRNFEKQSIDCYYVCPYCSFKHGIRVSNSKLLIRFSELYGDVTHYNLREKDLKDE
jgi:DNA-directed RNA polymerase subunit RPC12/RpoP